MLSVSGSVCSQCFFDNFVDMKNFLTPTKSLRYRGSRWWIFWQFFFSECRIGGLVVDLPFAPMLPET